MSTADGRTEEARRLAEVEARSYIELAGVMFVRVDADERVGLVNPEACSVLGGSQEEILGRNWFDHFIPQREREAVRQVFRRLLAGEVVGQERYQNSVLTLGGGERLIAWHNAVLRDAEGRVTAILGSGDDVTERVRVQKELQTSEERLRAVYDNVQVGILQADPESRRFVEANPSMCRMLGYTEAELLRLGVDDIHPPEALADVHESFSRQAAGEIRLAPEKPILRKDGSVGWADIRSAPVTVGGRTVLMGCFHEMTERRELRARLAQSDRLASMGMLAAGVAHEINNPLAYVLHSLEALDADLSNASEACGERTAVLASVRRALDGGRRIRDIVRDLHTFARVDDAAPAPVDAVAALERAAALADNQIRHRARLVRELAPVPQVLASQGKLAQVFLNLLVNAAQAIPEGDAQGNEIRLRSWSAAGQVYVEVRDSGPGIEPARRARVFEPFFTTKPEGVGAGLGLAICRNIVDGFGGELRVDSRLGEGASFTVCLPAFTERAAPPPTPPARTLTPAARKRPRLLIVDDEAALRESLVLLLRRHYELAEAASGAAAQALLEEDQAFDAILCDLMMPQRSGMDLHDWLLAAHPRLAARVVFMSGGAFTERARAHLASVSNPRLDKPFELSTLRATLRAVLEGTDGQPT